MIEGIDVSSWQGDIDWARVKSSDVQFAYVKATEGVTYTNPNFQRDWQGTRAHSIIRGAYHFLNPATSVVAQAEHFVQTVGALDALDLPPMLDLEGDKWNAVPVQSRLTLAQQWLAAVEKSSGVRPIIYTGFYFARDILRTPGHSQLSAYKLWIPNYNNVEKPLLPEPWQDWLFWQYTNTGAVTGISGNVDRNRFAGDVDDLVGRARN